MLPILKLLLKLKIGAVSIPSITLRLDQVPMLIAIGFITGHVIMQPLAVGLFSTVFVISPIYNIFFKSISHSDFVMAFSSGLVFFGAIVSFWELFKKSSKGMKKSSIVDNVIKVKNWYKKMFLTELDLSYSVIISILVLVIAMLSYFKFSILSQIYILILTFICSYQLMMIAGEMGLAPVGRFATYVMVPGMLLFKFNFVQLTLVSLFVEVVGGVASDIMFGRKMAVDAGLDRKTFIRYQWLGLIISSIVIGFVLWLLITTVGLGTPQLFAQKAQSRALLINFTTFNYTALIIGGIFGYALRFIRVNPVLVLGGILMPVDYSLMLILGGLLTYLTKDRENSGSILVRSFCSKLYMDVFKKFNCYLIIYFFNLFEGNS